MRQLERPAAPKAEPSELSPLGDPRQLRLPFDFAENKAPEVREQQFHFGVPCRDGMAKYTHLIRDAWDPERRPREPGNALRWRKLNDMSVEEWREAIVVHLSDGIPRTFNRIMVEITDGTTTADVAFRMNPDWGLWMAVERQEIVLTHRAPILFMIASSSHRPA